MAICSLRRSCDGLVLLAVTNGVAPPLAEAEKRLSVQESRVIGKTAEPKMLQQATKGAEAVTI